MFTTNAIVELLTKAIRERNERIADELMRQHHMGDELIARLNESGWEVVTSTFDKLLVKGPYPDHRVFLIEVKEAM